MNCHIYHKESYANQILQFSAKKLYSTPAFETKTKAFNFKKKLQKKMKEFTNNLNQQ